MHRKCYTKQIGYITDQALKMVLIHSENVTVNTQRKLLVTFRKYYWQHSESVIDTFIYNTVHRKNIRFSYNLPSICPTSFTPLISEFSISINAN